MLLDLLQCQFQIFIMNMFTMSKYVLLILCNEYNKKKFKTKQQQKNVFFTSSFFFNIQEIHYFSIFQLNHSTIVRNAMLLFHLESNNTDSLEISSRLTYLYSRPNTSAFETIEYHNFAHCSYEVTGRWQWIVDSCLTNVLKLPVLKYRIGQLF